MNAIVDGEKMIKVINSCRTPEQFESAKVMISLYSKKWNFFTKLQLKVHILTMSYYAYLDGFKTAYNMKT